MSLRKEASCPHRFFLEDFASNAERITGKLGMNWKVRCGHCDQTLAGSYGPLPPVTLRWKLANDTWFGTFTIEDPDHGTAP